MVNVSVIMPCYNASAYIAEAIQSVLSQSYKEWELLVVDDGSTDNSAEIVSHFAKADDRIHLIEQPNSGACRARNNGIEQATGEFIKFLDSDDMLEPECLALQIVEIQKLAERQIPFGDYYNVDKEGNIISKYGFDRQKDLQDDSVYFFFSEWRILTSSPLHRTALLREIGGFNEELKRGQESDLHLRLALADVEFVYFPIVTYRYRDHSATNRISENLKVGTRGRRDYYVQRAYICEQLFEKKYDSVPSKYNSYFANTWFSYARDLFDYGNKQKGKEYIEKAYKYGLQTSFQRFYFVFGKMIGYGTLEKIFRLRLRIMHQ
ncbi:MAG: glycosyltransferase [Bacteroidales bacterium]|nr:glycosyltransferase [Bacteroidales bacterium]